MNTNQTEKIRIGRLVESFSFGFGRIVEILSNGAFVVKFSYFPWREIVYGAGDTDALKFWNDSETNWL